MSTLSATIEGIGFWGSGLPSWDAARAFAQHGTTVDGAPARPSAQLLAPNERRRAPDTVAVALDVALAACEAAQRAPATLASVFASTHGDLAITDYMATTLASAPQSISPPRFNNSVHTAAAGYWTIGAGAVQPTPAIGAFDASFAQGLVDALAQLATGSEAVLLVAFDGTAPGPLGKVSRSTGLLGGALVLSQRAGGTRMRVHLDDGEVAGAGALQAHLAGNAMSPMLPLFDALAQRATHATLKAGPDRVLRVELTHD